MLDYLDYIFTLLRGSLGLLIKFYVYYMKLLLINTLPVKPLKFVIDANTVRSKGYGFVRFGDDGEKTQAMIEMNGLIFQVGPVYWCCYCKKIIQFPTTIWFTRYICVQCCLGLLILNL